MKTQDTTVEHGEDVLVELARHVAPTVRIGLPVLVMGRLEDGSAMVLTDDLDVWFVGFDGAERLAVLADGRRELAAWHAGREVSRIVGSG